MAKHKSKAVRPHLLRALKRIRLSVRGNSTTATPVFVLGTQRSGTKMTLKTLDRSPLVWAHDHRRRDLSHLGGADPAYVKLASGSMARLIETDSLKELISDCPADVVLFHAIAESQNALDLLHDHNGSRVVWVYRRYTDVANSALVAWGAHQKDLIRRVHDREFQQLRWRGERLPASVVDELTALYDPEMSDFDAGCLFWYMRNQFFFNLELETNPRVFLVQYEDFVQNPSERFRALFGWLGVPFDDSLVNHIFSSSVGKRPHPPIGPGVEELCDSVLNRLDEVYERQIDALIAAA